MNVVILTTKNINYDLATLLLAVNASERIHCASFEVQALAANSGDVLIGDPSMTASTYGLRLLPGESYTVQSGSGCNGANINALSVRGDNVDGLKLSINQSII